MAGAFRIYPKRYTREEVAKIDAFFVFGDNLERKGTGPKSGQAIIRGLPNALGIAVKRKPSMEVDAFFDDFDPACLNAICAGFANVTGMLKAGHDVYYPTDGIGTGRAQLKLHAPRCYWFVDMFVNHLLEKYP